MIEVAAIVLLVFAFNCSCRLVKAEDAYEGKLVGRSGPFKVRTSVPKT